MEATQAMTFSEKDNTREAYLSRQLLVSKHSANILYWAVAKKCKKTLNTG